MQHTVATMAFMHMKVQDGHKQRPWRSTRSPQRPHRKNRLKADRDPKMVFGKVRQETLLERS